MPRVARIAPRDHIFRIVTRGNNRQDVFRDEIDYLKYLEILNRYQEKYQFKLYHQAGRMKMGRFYFLDLEEWNGLGIWVLTRRPFLGNLALCRGKQRFTSRGTLSFNWLEKNAVEGHKGKIKK